MPLQQTDPLGIRPAQQTPMMQRMGEQTAPMLDAPLSAEVMAPVVNRMPQGTDLAGRPRSTDELLSALPQMGGPVTDFLTRQTIRQNAPAVDQFLSAPRSRSTLQPTTPAGVVDVAGPPTISEPPMAGAARALATRGRGMLGGPKDDMLVHMNRSEVQALADASPIGGLPINPDTGMPEAFAFLLPILGGIGGTALAGTLGMSALTAGALGTGLGGFAQGLVQGEDFGDALLRGVVGGVASYGLGSLFQGMSDPATQALASGNPAQQAAAADVAGAANIMPTMPAAPNVGTFNNPGSIIQSPAERAAAMGTFGSGGGYGASAGVPYGGAGPTTMPTNLGTGGVQIERFYPLEGGPHIGPNLPSVPYSSGGPPPLTGGQVDPTGMASQLGQSATPSLGSALKDAATDFTSPAALGRTVGSLTPDIIMPPGTPQVGSPLTSRKKKYDYKQNLPEAGDTEVTAAPEGYVPGRDPQHRYFQNRSFRFQEGGLVDAGIGGLDPKGEQEIVVNAKLAAMGRHPDPETALMAYAERFGVDALRKLMRGVTLQPGEGEALDGPGGGMADLIPAVIDNDQPARLSSGEVVVPADVVSGVGDGDTEAGARRLKDMMAQIRMAKTGSTRQPMPIDEAMAKV